ncbi:unnamed protein product [Discosporangium mesarthrocarpum]
MQVRCSTGVVCTDYLGPGVEQVKGELEFACLTRHQALVCLLRHRGNNLREGDHVYFQAALLYTSSSGQRLVRCHTLGLPVTRQLGHIFRTTDIETVSAVLTRRAVSQALRVKIGLQDILKEQVTDLMVTILFLYRKNVAPNSPSSQLIMPESLHMLPLYALCVLKTVALRRNVIQGTTDVVADERAFRLLSMDSMSVRDTMVLLWPRLFSLHDLPPGVGDVPPLPDKPATADNDGGEGAAQAPVRYGKDVPMCLPPTAEKLSSDGVFLLDSGVELTMYVGRAVSGEVLMDLFGVRTLPGGKGGEPLCMEIGCGDGI